MLGWTPAEAASSLGVSRPTAYNWLKRSWEEGEAGLEDRSSRPRRCPHRLERRVEREILRARRGPHHLAATLGRPRSTTHGVLRRHGVNRLDRAERPSGVPVRYREDRPGELVYLDVKELGRIPPGGAPGCSGGAPGPASGRGTNIGYDYLHVAVDDHSRVAYVRALPDERGGTAARFLLETAARFAELGVRIERVMTDLARSSTGSRPSADALARIGARHEPSGGYRPQTNGKAEAFIRTMLNEWAHVRLYRSNEERLRALPRRVNRYNCSRPHTALGGRPDVGVVNNVGGNRT